METTIEIQNLKCGGCAHTITTQVESIKGVSATKVNEDTSEVSFNYSSDKELAEVIAKLAKWGYPVVGDANTAFDKAKSYVSCAIGKVTK